ncbi:sensor histidine kinase [Allochromatium palmeri]|uniref:histidine kinase n=1 Tax=Allochromatium palmeri TaxID=231048 RepID=A0A6N8EG23_9GAMM|nr:HAMP domain-containing sensor histidine kinase [Allochromatium palmeri]MTW21779.1 sensor histidine kinase [Allochromatium palmeri]
MRRGSDHDRARHRLRLGIGLFVLALAAPSLWLVYTAYDQMKWESFRQQQLAAEGLAERIDQTLAALARAEDRRPIEDYDFLAPSADPASPYRRRSPLSEWPLAPTIPGLLGWFQVAADGTLSSPLVPEAGSAPAALGIDPADLAQRQARVQQIQGILVGNRLVERDAQARESESASPVLAPATAPAPESSVSMQDEAPNRLSQSAFEGLAANERLASKSTTDTGQALGRVDDLKLDLELAERGRRKDAATDASAPQPAAVNLFASTVEPCEVGRLDSGHLLLFRTVWRGGERLIQGALIEQTPFLEQLIGVPLTATALARTTHLIVAYRGEVLASFRAESPDDYASRATRLVSTSPPPLTGALLYRARMAEPFGGLELIFSVSRLPAPAGAAVIGWMAATLALVLLAGGWLLYRLGMRQLDLIRQQQDFVAAVSHELKTPLTSIRMYAEMLRAGFASEERKSTYYRFIHEESERLSRLIANVLQLARIGREALVLEPRVMPIGELMALVVERVASQIERAGFRLELSSDDSEAELLVDPDAFVQILINLVDNALKFAAEAETRSIRLDCETLSNGRVRVCVRDFGPGIPRDQRRRVFQLFQRGDMAKSQAIPGTGIGLALVERLTHAMGGRVEVMAAEPGAEFRLEFPLNR